MILAQDWDSFRSGLAQRSLCQHSRRTNTLHCAATLQGWQDDEIIRMGEMGISGAKNMMEYMTRYPGIEGIYTIFMGNIYLYSVIMEYKDIMRIYMTRLITSLVWWFGTMEFYDFPQIGNNNPN